MQNAQAAFLEFCTNRCGDYSVIRMRDIVGPDEATFQSLDASRFLTVETFGYSRAKFFSLDEINFSSLQKLLTSESCVGLDCEWRPVHRRGSLQAAALLQLAFSNAKECWVVDLCTPLQSDCLSLPHIKLRDRLFELLFDPEASPKIIGFSLNNDLAALEARLRVDEENDPASYATTGKGAEFVKSANFAGPNKGRLSDVEFAKKYVDLQRPRVRASISDAPPGQKQAQPEKLGGLSDLALRKFGQPLCKDLTILNWEIRPLEPVWLEYAALDAVVPAEYYVSELEKSRNVETAVRSLARKPADIAESIG